MILVLGGTAEARALASLLDRDGVSFVSSLAGRVSNPRLPPGEVRVGGFGGAAGLAEYLSTRGISRVVDATHPFAARITANAAEACARTGTPLLVLRRPPWLPEAGDDWRPVPDIATAAALVGELPERTRVLLTTGRQEAAAFAALPQRFRLRCVEPPDPPLPRHCEIVLDRGPFALEAERRLLGDADLLVTKNSGGDLTAPKLRAARELRVPVIIVNRPPLPEGVEVAGSVAAAYDWVG